METKHNATWTDFKIISAYDSTLKTSIERLIMLGRNARIRDRILFDFKNKWSGPWDGFVTIYLQYVNIEM